MAQHKVVVQYRNDRKVYLCNDVSPMPSGAVELTFEDGTTKIVQNFMEMDVIPQEGVSVDQVLREDRSGKIVNRGDI